MKKFCRIEYRVYAIFLLITSLVHFYYITLAFTNSLQKTCFSKKFFLFKFSKTNSLYMNETKYRDPKNFRFHRNSAQLY